MHYAHGEDKNFELSLENIGFSFYFTVKNIMTSAYLIIEFVSLSFSTLSYLLQTNRLKILIFFITQTPWRRNRQPFIQSYFLNFSLYSLTRLITYIFNSVLYLCSTLFFVYFISIFYQNPFPISI